MSSNNEILSRCDCYIENFHNCSVSPSSYINNLRFWCSSYKFHFKHEHKEKFVAPFFLINFITNIINITSYFRREVDLLNVVVIHPIEATDLLDEAIKEYLILLLIASKAEKIPISELNKCLELFNQILSLWEMYIFQNGINKFV